MLRKKTLGKRRQRTAGNEMRILENEIATEQNMSSNNAFQLVNEALGKHSDNLSPNEQQRLYKAMKNKYNRGVDLGYLKTILFPEYFKYDIPSPLTNLSYCKFDDKQDAIIATGGVNASAGVTAISGTGMLLWFPRVTSGPSLFVWTGAAGSGGAVPTSPGQYTPFTAATSTTSAIVDVSKWQTGFEQYYSTYFTQTQLIAASLSVQYIGQQEQESGMWVGGHIFGQTPDQLTVDDIENSQFVTRARPNEGLRFVYLPSEGTDYEFYPTKLDNAHNGGAEPQGNEQTFIWPAKTDSSNKNFQGAGYNPQIPGTATNVNSNITYMSNTNYVAVYWNGLPVGQNWIRVDATRQFNGIPKQQYRNIVSVSRSKKNFNSKKTFDVLRALCVTQASIGGHTLKDVDAQMDRIVEALPNVVDMVNNGDSMETTKGLGEFAEALERPMSMANQKGLVGAIPQQTRRLYPYA